MQQYTGAAQVAGITVDAQTWQIDYQARLLGIEEDMRLANLDNYGHTAFIQGFDVTQQADPAKYKVAPGVVYVGGLRAELKTKSFKPSAPSQRVCISMLFARVPCYQSGRTSSPFAPPQHRSPTTLTKTSSNTTLQGWRGLMRMGVSQIGV